MAVLLFATSLGSELTGVHGVGAAPRQPLLAAYCHSVYAGLPHYSSSADLFSFEGFFFA
jgi:hypothetical protein